MKKKKRKKRNTEYSKAWKVVDRYGLETVKKTWQEYGMYETAVQLQTSPWTIRYIAHKHNFKRDARHCPHLVKAVQRGNVKPSYYKNLDWSDVEINNKPNKSGDNND